jgi:hypothetical protein
LRRVPVLFPVPDHQTDVGLVRDETIFLGVKVEHLFALVGRYGSELPLSNIVATGAAGAEHFDVPIVLRMNVLLDRFVDAVGVADEHRKSFTHDVVESFSNLCVQLRNVP